MDVQRIGIEHRGIGSLTQRSANQLWWITFAEGSCVYFLSSAVVLLAIALGPVLIPTCTEHIYSQNEVILDGFVAWDGYWYKDIASRGYFFERHDFSSAAFFPAYPLAARAVHNLTGMSIPIALLVVAHLFLLLTFVILAAYLRIRKVEYARYVLLACALFPSTFYMRAAYTESMFLCLCLLTMVLIETRQSAWLVALVIGLATATRFVGIALLAPLVIYLYDQSQSKWHFAAKAVAIVPLALWGLAAFSLFLFIEFGDPWAFATAQLNWAERPRTDVLTTLRDLFLLQPLMAVYDASSPCYWALDPPRNWTPLLNFTFMNPILFTLVATLVGIGAWKKILTNKEIALSIGLLAIPYAKGYLMCFTCSARYAAVAFPAYIVAGWLLARTRTWLQWGSGVIAVILLFVYSSLFATWYWFY